MAVAVVQVVLAQEAWAQEAWVQEAWAQEVLVLVVLVQEVLVQVLAGLSQVVDLVQVADLPQVVCLPQLVCLQQSVDLQQVVALQQVAGLQQVVCLPQVRPQDERRSITAAQTAQMLSLDSVFMVLRGGWVVGLVGCFGDWVVLVAEMFWWRGCAGVGVDVGVGLTMAGSCFISQLSLFRIQKKGRKPCGFPSFDVELVLCRGVIRLSFPLW